MVCVCPSFRKAFPFMRNTWGTGRASARVNDGDGWGLARVRRRRRDDRGWDAARGVSRRAETYVGQAFPNGRRFRPIRPKRGAVGQNAVASLRRGADNTLAVRRHAMRMSVTLLQPVRPTDNRPQRKLLYPSD